MASERVEVEVDGRTLSLSNLQKVLYPETGTTKAEVIDYYVRIAPTMLPHIADRGITMRRFPDGVEGGSFFEKRCPSHRPDFVTTAPGPGESKGPVDYCVLDEVASLAWTANMGALEIHSPMARHRDIDSPTMLVFDLDPGPGTDITDCARVAVDVRDLLEKIEIRCFAKTSGSKGMQVYVPLNRPHGHDHTSSFALAVGQVMEKAQPKRIVTTMAKAARRDRILIDWSQNSRHKTTIAPYSLRGRARPTVSTPVTWQEVEAAADGAPLAFEASEVLERVEEHGDRFAETLTLEQDLPAPRT